MDTLTRLATLIRTLPDHGDWEVSHDLFFARRERAESAAREARTLGCAVELHEPRDPSHEDWIVVVRYPAVPEPATVNPVSRALRALAARHAGAYAGWSGGHRRRVV